MKVKIWKSSDDKTEIRTDNDQSDMQQIVIINNFHKVN